MHGPTKLTTDVVVTALLSPLQFGGGPLGLPTSPSSVKSTYTTPLSAANEELLGLLTPGT